MADKRRHRRWPRQLDARFSVRGEEKDVHRAIVTNISVSGAFLRTPKVSPPGTRIRIDMMHGGRGNMIEAVVARALRTPSHFQTVKPSGMGLRFLLPHEIVQELLPGIPVGAEVTTTRAPAGSSAKPASGAPAGEGTVKAAPGGARAGTAGRSAVPSRGSATVDDENIVDIHYESLDRFATAFERDIMTGGLFVPVPKPPPLNSIVHIRIGVAGHSHPPVVVKAQVVHRIDGSTGDSGGHNLLAGMGVQFVDQNRAASLLRVFLG